MKKLIFIFSLLIAAVCVSAQPGGSGANPIIVTGTVTNMNTGAPLANREVYVSTNDSIMPFWGYGITDAAGEYEIIVEGTSGVSEVLVSVFNYCSSAGPTVDQIAVVTNGTAVSNFQLDVCSTGTCTAIANYQATVNPLEQQFWGYGYDQWGDSTTFFTYTWDFGDGTFGTGETPLHTYAQVGTYTVILTASSPNCVATYSLEVVVQLYQVVTVSGTITDPNGNPVPYWSVQAGNSYTTTDANGFYTVQVNVPASDSTVIIYTYTFCDSFPDPTQSGYVEAPIINNTATANFVLCDVVPPIEPCSAYMTYNQVDTLTFAFQYYTYSQDTSQVVQVTWDFGDGTTSNEEMPVHTYAVPGVYTVLLTAVTSTGCESHACDVVFAFDDSTYCPVDTFYYGCQAMYWAAPGFDPAMGTIDPLTVTFSDISFGSVLTRHWDFGDGSTSTDGPTVAHTYAAPGLYEVTLSITTQDGCESEVTMQVYAGDYPWVEHDCQALYMPFPDSTGNGFFFLDLSIANVPVQSWAWDFGDGTTSTEQNPFHVFAQSGVYTVTLTIVADSCSSVISFEIDTDNPFNRFEGGGIQGVAAGVSSTKEPETLLAARIAPNPVTDRINLAFESKIAQDVQVNVINAAGKVIRTATTTAQSGWNALQIPAADLATGFYYLQIQGGKSTQTIKLVKADK
jgi:PKD repeat protein